MRVACSILAALVLALSNCNPVSSVEGAEARGLAATSRSARLRPPLPTAPVSLMPVFVRPEPHPLDALEQGELQRLVRQAPAELGSLSIGSANRGALFNGVQMPESDHWELVDPARSWATRESVEAISAAIRSVAREHAGSPKLFIGDMSKARGGYFRPHRSHQSGCDADVGYYYLDGPGWYKNADEQNLDRRRTWSLIKALLTQGSVQYLFIDKSVQALLRTHALEVEHDDGWVERLFSHAGGKAEGTLRHARGHKTHMHVRFFNDTARESSRRAHTLLARFGKI